MEFEDYLNEMLNGFKNDPADTDYQKGYQAAIEHLRDTYFPQK